MIIVPTTSSRHRPLVILMEGANALLQSNQEYIGQGESFCLWNSCTTSISPQVSSTYISSKHSSILYVCSLILPTIIHYLYQVCTQPEAQPREVVYNPQLSQTTCLPSVSARFIKHEGGFLEMRFCLCPSSLSQQCRELTGTCVVCPPVQLLGGQSLGWV